MGAREERRNLDGSADFTTLLQHHMTRTQRRDADLARLSSIPARTIEKWRRGEARRPRQVVDALKLALALALDATQTSQFLQAAGYPPLEELRQQAQKEPDPALASLMAAWPAPEPANTATGAQPPSSAQRHQLRPPVADFAGRAQETAQLVAALLRAVEQGQGAIISGVQGMGGVGKTELAYRVAHELRHSFPDAQLVLDLRGSTEAPLTPVQTLQAAIRTFVLDEQLIDDLPTLERRYRALLHGQRALIFADDARDAAQVRALLPPAGSALLITSRQRFTLPGMTSVQLEQLSEQEAITLLRGICGRLNEAEAQAIAHSCGYLPLALRVSGGMLHNDPALEVVAYFQQLSDERLRLSHLRDPDDPQLDVEASLLLSYAQLDATVQQVFRQLGVLVADFATELGLAVVEPPTGVDLTATLRLLLRRNLVMYDSERGRWRMHDLVRDMARQQLDSAGETEALMWRYGWAMVAIAQEAQEQYLTGGENILVSLRRFDAERPHIDAAHRWAAAYAGTDAADRLLVANAEATIQIGSLRYDQQSEYIPQWERACAAAQRLGERHAQTHILMGLGFAYRRLGDNRATIPLFARALALAREISDHTSEHESLTCLGAAHALLGEHWQALVYYEQALILIRERGDLRVESSVLTAQGAVYIDLGDSRRAIGLLEQALIIAREVGDQLNEADTLQYLGCAYAELGSDERAILYYEQAIGIARQLGDRSLEGDTLSNLGSAYASLGDAERAITYCEQALNTAREAGFQHGEAYALSELARAYTILGQTIQATTIFEQALILLDAVGDRWRTARCNWLYGLLLTKQEEYERGLPLLRAALAYEQEIGHAQAAEHAALLAQLEAGVGLPADLLRADEDALEPSRNGRGH